MSLPFNMLTFLLLKGLSWLLRRFQILTPVHKPVRPFRTFATFFSTAFVENMTYLSFHSFLHLSKFVPYSHGRNIFPSCIFCLLLFFTALMTALCLAPAAWLLSRKFFKIEYCKVNFKSYLFFTFAAIGKLCSGFFHAYIDDAKYRIFGLFVVNVCVFAVLLFCCKAMQCKTYLIIYLGLYFGKVVLHLQLFQEIWVSEILISMPDTTTQNSFILVILIFGLMFIIFLMSKARCMY
jgi:hypothetical protein